MTCCPLVRKVPRNQILPGGRLLTGVLLAGFFLLAASLAFATSKPSSSRPLKRILALYSEPLDTPVTEATQRGIREILLGNTNFQAQIFSEYLDLSRFRDIRQRTALADLLRLRYLESEIDLILSVGVPAAVFLLEEGESVFPKIPIVVCSVPEPLVHRLAASPLKDRTTGIFYSTKRGELVEDALALLPQTKYAVLVAGAFEYDQMRTMGFREAVDAFGERLQLMDLTGLSIGDLIERLRKIPPDSVIFYSTFFVDRAGRSFVPRDVLKIISDTADAPVFGPYEQYLGHGIVGGRLVSMSLQGKKAAETACVILGGKAPSSIPYDQGTDTFINVYDWRQLNRWRISEAGLPAGSVVINREATAWDLYKSYIIGFVSLIVVEGMLIIALVINLQRRKRAELALLSSREDLKTLAGRLISAQEEELSRLSREFHDDLAQRLAAVAIESGTLELHSKHVEPPVLQKIGHIKDQLITLAEDVHAISRQIHPSILKDLGLARAIDSQCVRFSDRENIPVAFHSHDIPGVIPKEVALCIYRITQESLRNIAKHSRARNVEISLRRVQGNLLLEIGDDGIGFDPRCARLTPGIGLASMRERVQYVNGEFNINSEPGKGALIEVSVPIEKGK